MEIIVPKLKRYSDGEIDRAFMKEIKTGFKRERETEKQRVAGAAKEAQALKGATHPTLGKPVASIPPREYFHKEVRSRDRAFKRIFKVLQ